MTSLHSIGWLVSTIHHHQMPLPQRPYHVEWHLQLMHSSVRHRIAKLLLLMGFFRKPFLHDRCITAGQKVISVHRAALSSPHA